MSIRVLVGFFFWHFHEFYWFLIRKKFNISFLKTYLKQKKQNWTRQKNIDDLFHLLHVLIITVNSFSLIHLHQKSIHFSLAFFLFVYDDCFLIYVLSRKFLTFWMSINLCINAVNLGGMLIAWSEKYSGMTSNTLYTWISAMDTCESQKKL